MFSADGDLAPLIELAEVAREAGAGLIVDEAHALGAVGLEGREPSPRQGSPAHRTSWPTATLSKALGSQGGVALGPPTVIAHLVDAARSFIFDTALAPASVGSALGALRVLQAGAGAGSRGSTRSPTGIAGALGAAIPAAAVVSLSSANPNAPSPPPPTAGAGRHPGRLLSPPIGARGHQPAAHRRARRPHR